LKAAPPRRSRSVGADIDRAMALHREGRLDEAEALYRGVLRADAAHFDALHLLGVIEGQHGRFEAALPLLERAVALRPDNAAALNNLGNTLAGLQRFAAAVERFDRALALKTENPKALRNRGTALRRLGRLDEAMGSFDRALAIAPDFSDAMVSRAELLQQLHRTGEAIAAFRAALAGGKDVEVLHYALAALGAEPMPAAAPPAYVQALFDEYAHSFESHLVETLKYRAPALIAAAAQKALPRGGLEVVDLGCGTGLCGPLLRPLARRLVGVDLSQAMLERARRGAHYDELVQAELVAWLASQRAAFDLAVAADVLIYLGDLDPTIGALRGALRPGGACVFSVEATTDSRFALKPSRRYGHAVGYLRGLAERHGFAVEALDAVVLREDVERDIDGHLVVLRAPA
jgi:predicted TPR repeat methyltransferase